MRPRSSAPVFLCVSAMKIRVKQIGYAVHKTSFSHWAAPCDARGAVPTALQDGTKLISYMWGSHVHGAKSGIKTTLQNAV